MGRLDRTCQGADQRRRLPRRRELLPDAIRERPAGAVHGREEGLARLPDEIVWV